jgi:WD repeat-containing protein 48
LNEEVAKNQAANQAKAPNSIDIPASDISSWDMSDQVTTPRANGLQLHQGTPALGIGLATPAPGTALSGVPEEAVSGPLSPPEKGAAGDKDDYFAGGSAPATESSDAKTSMDNSTDKSKDKDKDKDKDKNAKDDKPDDENDVRGTPPQEGSTCDGLPAANLSKSPKTRSPMRQMRSLAYLN